MKQYLSLWPYATVNLLYYSILGGFVSYLAILLTDKQFSSVEIGQVFAVFTVGRMVTGHFWANWADKFQAPKLFFQLGIGLTLAFLLPLIWVTDKQLVFYLVIAVMTAFWTVISQLEVLSLAAANSSPVVYNRIRLFGSLGFILAAIGIGWQLEQSGSEVIVWYSISCLVAQLLLSFALTEPQAGHANSSAPANSTQAVNNRNSDFYQRCLQPGFIVFLLASILLQMSFAPYIGFFTQYLAQSGYQGAQVGVLFSLGTLSEIFMFLIAGKVLSRFNVKLLFSICLLLTAGRWLAQGYLVDVVPLLILTQCIHALSYGLMHSASIYFIGQHFASEQQNRGQFMYLGVTFGIGGSVGAWLTGKTWLEGAGSTDTFLWAAAAAFIAALLILITPRRNFQFLQHSSSV